MDDKFHSKFGYHSFDKNGNCKGWTRITHDVDKSISYARNCGMTLIIGDLDDDIKPIERDEILLYDDMSYAACRDRYQKRRKDILKEISDGHISASMSSIDYYPYDWDDVEPRYFEQYLKPSMTWNGVCHIKNDWLQVLMLNHPKCKGA